MHGTCPSFSQGVSRHSFQPTQIPSDQILIFVKDQYQQGRVGPLIDKLFYTTLPISEPASKSQTWKPEKEALTREEIWQRFGLVLVRRAQGKWVTWERISQL